MKRRALLVSVGAALLARPALGQPNVQKRVGYLTSQSEDDPTTVLYRSAVLKGLSARGWELGRDLEVDLRYGNLEPARIEAGARELVAEAPDALFGTTTPPTAALKKLTSTIPIVFGNVSDPIGSGFVKSFARPGTNVTGCSNYEDSVAGKWLEFLLRVAPGAHTVGLMFNPKTAPGAGDFYWKPFESIARASGIDPVRVPVESVEEIDSEMARLAQVPSSALVVASDIYMYGNRERVAAAAAANHLPAMYPYTEYAQAGGLISYAIDLEDTFFRAGQLLGRILDGENPADLPVQGPTRFITTINLATARAQGITVPPDLLATADELIE